MSTGQPLPLLRSAGSHRSTTEVRVPAPADRGRRLLPLLLPNHPLGRSETTCLYRCANACAHDAPNTSDNAYFGDVVREVVSRRGALKAGAVLTVAGLGAATLGTGSAAAAPSTPAPSAS